MAQAKKELPTANNFCVNTPLYAPFEVTTTQDTLVARDILFTKNTIDCFCIECGEKSVFIPEANTPLGGSGARGSGVQVLSQEDLKAAMQNEIPVITQKKFTCSRNSEHRLYFFMKFKDGLLSKIGQSPALADIVEQEVRKYRKILGEVHYNEFSKAVGLYSHGVGIGSFVYLRRIIENFIIKPAHEDAKQKANWDEGNYQQSRVGEKVKLLKDYLPEYLVQNKVIYSIVSKGLHELTEDECKEYFPVLKACLELVLTDLETKRETEQKKKAVQQEMEKIAGKII